MSLPHTREQTALASALARPPRPGPMLLWFAVWCGCTAASVLYLTRGPSPPLVRDEVYWIGSSYYFHLAVVARDGSHPDWRLLPARENPPGAKYVLGLALALQGQAVTTPDLLGGFYGIFRTVPHAWGEGDARAKRAAVVARMTPEVRAHQEATNDLPIDISLVRAARRTVLACVVLSSLCLFVLGSLVAGRTAGLIASQLLLVHPAVVEAATHALADGVALLFSCVAATLVFCWTRQRGNDHGPSTRARGAWALSVATGTSLALACAAKMNALVLVVVFSCCLAGLLFRPSPVPYRRRLLAHGAVVAASGAAAFVGLNPAVWGDLMPGLHALVREHQLTEAIQARFLSDHLHTLGQKAGAVTTLAFRGTAGLAALALAAGIAGARLHRAPLAAYPLLWCLVAAACVVVWIPFPRERYILPVVVPAVLLLAVVSPTIFHIAGRAIRRPGRG